MDVHEALEELGRMLYGADEAAVQRFARGRVNGEREAREVWAGAAAEDAPASQRDARPGSATPAGDPVVEDFYRAYAQAVTAEVAASGVGLAEARRRVTDVVARQPAGMATSQRTTALRDRATRLWSQPPQWQTRTGEQ